MVPRSAAQGFTVAQIAAIGRESEAAVWRWLTRDPTTGRNGLRDAPRLGRPSEMTEASRAVWLAAVRRRPRRMGLPFSRWTLQRLVDYLAEHTSIRVSDETVRRALKQAGIVHRRPQPTINSPDPDDQVITRRWKIRATTCIPGMTYTTPTHAISAGGPPCAPCGARGLHKS
jgi:transposase